jgi:oligoribonuclease NrnB/cAMP/cGMP phosphodiesterase (DHH superfamily)
MDGSTCAVLFVAAGGKRENIIFSYPTNHIVEEHLDYALLRNNNNILLVDVSVSKEYAEKLHETGRVLLLDHHKAAVSLDEFDWCDIDIENERCGARMFFDWIQRNREPSIETNRIYFYRDLVMAVDDRDRFVNEIPESEKMATLHYVLGQKLFIDRFIKYSPITLTHQEIYAIDLEEKKKVEFIEKRKKETVVKTLSVKGELVRVGFVLANTYQTEVGYATYTDLDLDVDIVVIVGLNKVSFRSDRDCSVDLSEIAKLNGGGGHFHASGSNLGKVLGKDFLELVIERLVWE